MITLKQLRDKLGPQVERLVNPQDLNDALLTVRLDEACERAMAVLNREPIYTAEHFEELGKQFRNKFPTL